jgi:alkanesulfonate monooxygenase SsuD/methylene tetrahydromethanopterin reductase-like flavin-dependent oxidoreductase (luciferase family)
VIVQAGDSPAGRDFAASHAEVIFTRHGADDEARAFYADVHNRLTAAGRSADSLLVLPGASFVLGDTPEDAREKAEHIAHQQISGATAISVLEQVWGRDLSDLDPDGPLPDFDPVDATLRNGQVRHYADVQATADAWRAKAAAEGLSARELVISTTQKPAFLGTAHQVATQIAHSVNTRASDGFVLVPNLIPTGLDEFVDTVIPELQDLGVYPNEYQGSTLREHLGLPLPAGYPTGREVLV